MIKRIAALLAVLMLFSLAACSQNKSEGAPSPTVDSNTTITRTLPSMYVTEDINHFDAQGYAEAQGFDSVTYDDITDTFTLVMRGERYNQLISDLYENVSSGVAEILESDYYSYIKDIKFIDDLGQFTLYVDRDAYLATEDYTPEYIASFAVIYREVLGLSAEVDFSIIDAQDGTELGFMTLPEEE